MTDVVQLQVLHVPDCPLLPRMREMLRECLAHVSTVVVVDEVVGDYPSPTVVVDGLDVVTGQAPRAETTCRLDLPTVGQILTALRNAAPGRHDR
ncbi:MAG: hypothetical protein ACRDP6_14175 [Actinoallomurus sp.]